MEHNYSEMTDKEVVGHMKFEDLDMTQESTAYVIKEVPYEFNKQGAIDCFITYLKQEIVWDEFVQYVKAYADWLKATKPELFQPVSSFATSGSYLTEETVKIPAANPHTQKAKGIKHIAKNHGGFRTIPFELVVGEDRDQEAVDAFMKKYAEVFARPCPETPRHGFVDSRRIKGVEAVFKLFNEVREVDPRGELIIMKPIEASRNCVITPYSITIGPGHDGATAGKNTKTFPLFNTWPANYGEVSKAGIADGDVPYLETVSSDKNTHYITQMRGGPGIQTRSVDYVPQQTVVSTVIKAEGDLLKWESTMKEYAGRDGVVVDHSNGALTSHYGVHAILNKIPVLTSRAPQVGETLAVQDDTAKHDYMSFMAGLIDSLKTPYGSGASKRVTAMIYATQYFSGIGGTDTYHIGYAVGTMLSFGTAACGGEYRHVPNNPSKKHYSRDTVYKRATTNFLKYRVVLGKWARSFALDPWKGGFGGMKWYDCADAVIQLDTVTRKFMRTPSEETFSGMMMAMNRAINCAHNGGWWFNKFIDSGVFNSINSERLPTIVTAVSYLYDQPTKAFGIEHLDFYSKYSGAKVINTKLTKSEPLTPIAAQVRPIHFTVGVDVTPDNVGTSARLQIHWDNGNKEETDVVVDGMNEKWEFSNTAYQPSYHSGLMAYLPCKWRMVNEQWEFYLESTGLVITTKPLVYGLKRIRSGKKEK